MNESPEILPCRHRKKGGCGMPCCFCRNTGFPIRWQEKIYKTYGMRLYSVMQENPYLLAEDIVLDLRRQMRSPDGSASIPIRITGSAAVSSTPTTGIGRGAYVSAEILSVSAGIRSVGPGEEQIEPQLANLMMDKKWWSKRKRRARSCMPCRIITQS